MRLGAHSIGIAGALAIAVSGCTGADRTTPAATLTSVTTGPSPADVLRAYADAAAPGRLMGHVSFHESTSYAGQQVVIDSEIDLSGASFTSATTGTILGKRREVRTTLVDGRTFVKTGAGPWIGGTGSSTSGAGGDTGAAYTLPADKLHADGTEDRGGQVAYRFTADAADVMQSVTASQAVDDFKGSYELLLRADGLPIEARFSGGWTQQGADAPMAVTAELRVTFRDLGIDPKITAPTDVWQTYASHELKFDMAHPDGWTEHEDKAGGGVRFIDPATSQELRVYMTEVRYDLSQADWIQSVLDNYRAVAGDPQASEPISALDLDSQVLAYHLTVGGELRLFLDVPLKPSSLGYDVQWLGDPGDEEVGRGLLNLALATLHINE